ncbi:P-loop NTPase fold protein [Pedobacter sp. UC225_65]|uniref:P-loop NTPase fold protein n=1 Tax=Pedobacter sp. UC225_65 TaxID=3350173 RepID=UPI0036718FB2
MTSLIYSYSRKLSSTDENSKRWLNRIGLFNDFQKGIISNDYDKINDILKRTNKKILIIIDDIDRLYNEEVIEVLRIIRNTADFANVFYLVAYEKTYVQNAIKSLNDQSASNYLDKIFQVEIPLPKREQDALVDFLKVKINTILSEEHFKILDERIIPLGLKDPYEESYAQIFRHSRDVIKFVNGFKLVYTLIGDEVSFEDLFVLELIKFRFPLVYDVIYEEQDTLLYLKPSMASHDEFFLVRQEKKGDDMFNIFDIYIEQSGLVKKNELELLCTLFNRLFSTGNFHRPAFKNGISYPLYFEVFFRQRLSKYDLSDKDFKIALQTNKINKFINDCVTKNLHDAILTRLLQEDIVKTSRDYFENIVMALFYLGPRYILKKSTSSFPYIQLLDKIIDYSGLIAKNFYKKDEDEYRIFIRTFFKMAQPPFLFESQLIYHIVESKRPFIISTNELIEFQIQYFKSIVETLHGLNENAVWLFWGIREYYELEHKTEKKRNWKFVPDVIPILIKALKKNNITLFLKNTIERNIWENEMACINKHIIEMFETPQEFRQIVNDNIYIDDAIKKEYIELYDACEKINFSKMVSFTFKTELKK